MAKIAHIETPKGEIVLELFEKDAPGHVENFAGLASGTKEFTDPKTGQKTKRPYYDGLTFHRVIPNFMIQGGCPIGNGTGGPGYEIADENVANHDEAGLLCMANHGPNTGGSQFFICHGPSPHLDGVHTVFGKVISGLEVVDAIKTGDKMTKVWIEEK